jgi:hypothetical protein
MRRALEQIEIPGEHEVRDRSWHVVAAAFSEQRPARRRSRRKLVPAVAIIAMGAVLAAALSSSGKALLHSIRQTVGVRGAQPALFGVVTPGTLLVHSDSGVWAVQSDGSKRRLGPYRSASWSPHGLYVAATTKNELVALTPTGTVRWSLARPSVRSPRWTGTTTDSRIAYTTGHQLRVVGGDGRGDAVFGSAPDLGTAPLAWRPGTARHVLGYALPAQKIVRVVDIDARGEEVWSKLVTGRVSQLEWSTDGRLLLVVTKSSAAYTVAVFRPPSRRPVSLLHRPPGTLSASFRPGTHEVAIVSRPGEVARVELAGKTVFSAAGDLRGLSWSPDGRWLLVGWPDADQWAFIPVRGGRAHAVANISAQFRSQTFPRVEGWCCAP